MDITIIGTGNMGRGIAAVALAGGHEDTLIGTEKDKAQALADELGASVTAGDSVAGDVVVLAVPYAAATDVLEQFAGQLGGKTVVDITNPVDFSTFEPLAVEAGSAAEEIAAAAPDGASVVKAFNTTLASTLPEREVAGQPLDLLIAGDDDDAKAKVRELGESAGLRVIDAGPLRRAHQLEAVGYLHMAVQDTLGTGFGSTVKFVS
jgi:hypothetical protein